MNVLEEWKEMHYGFKVSLIWLVLMLIITLISIIIGIM